MLRAMLPFIAKDMAFCISTFFVSAHSGGKAGGEQTYQEFSGIRNQSKQCETKEFFVYNDIVQYRIHRINEYLRNHGICQRCYQQHHNRLGLAPVRRGVPASRGMDTRFVKDTAVIVNSGYEYVRVNAGGRIMASGRMMRLFGSLARRLCSVASCGGSGGGGYFCNCAGESV